MLQVLARRTDVKKANDGLANAAELLASDYTEATATKYSAALEFWESVGAADFEARARDIAARVRLSDENLRQPTSALSGGQAARVELAVALLHTAPILFLDEPTNNLDSEGIALLESSLLEPHVGVVIVSHDRALLDRVATSILELDDHSRDGTLFNMGWKSYLEQRERQRRRAQQEFSEHERERERLVEQMRREQRWASRGSSGGKAKDGDKLRRSKAKERAEGSAGRARRTADRIERLDPVDKPWEGWDLRLEFPSQERSGDRVASLKGASIDYGTKRIGPFTCEVLFGDRIAITGENGAGKSTLLQLITGTSLPSDGIVDLGSSLEIGVISQERTDDLIGESLLEAVLRLSRTTEEECRSSLAKLGLSAEHIHRRPGQLSPGERTRAMLAVFQVRGVNFMILDEPTNHLDIEAMEQLEIALSTYSGTLILVTHDRTFLNNVATTRQWAVQAGSLCEA